jgi:hypothetical protein
MRRRVREARDIRCTASVRTRHMSANITGEQAVPLAVP